MDRYNIENFLLKVGRSYYKSGEFLRTRASLAKRGLDFKPVSEFGIGFMSVFMLGDRVEVETAPWASTGQDTRKRRLRIDGVGRLIEVYEEENAGPSRYYGTRVTVQLASRSEGTPSWQQIKSYVRDVCRNLSFPLYLEHFSSSGTEHSEIHPEGLVVPVPEHLLEAAVRIAVDDQQVGLKGEIVIYRQSEAASAEAALAAHAPVEAQPNVPQKRWGGAGVLTRGGFSVGSVPALPHFVLTPDADARIEATRDQILPRSLPRTDLSRSQLVQQKEIGDVVFRAWLDALLSHIEETEAKPIGSPDIDDQLLREAMWLESYSAFDLYRVACTCWPFRYKDQKSFRKRLGLWENGDGSILWIGDTYSTQLHKKIFDLILPSISELKVGRWYELYVFHLQSQVGETLS
jgi:hypothetical protein